MSVAPPDVDQGIRRILRFDLLRAELQPVFRIADGAIFGFEGLIRGPKGSPLESPAQLFAAADLEQCRVELELAAMRAVCRSFAALKLPGYLMINLGSSALDVVTSGADRTIELINAT